MYEIYQKLGIHVKELMSNNIFPGGPLESPNAYKFLYAVKKNDLRIVRRMISVEKYIVYQYDNVSLVLYKISFLIAQQNSFALGG